MINKNQRIHLMAELWPDACKAQGWKKSDDAKRYEVFANVLTAGGYPRAQFFRDLLEGQGYISANNFDNDDFSAVKKELLHLADTITIRDPKKTQYLWLIRNVKMRELGVYVEHPDQYVTKILRERFKRVRGINTLEDLSAVKPLDEAGKPKASQMEQYIFTLSGRISDFRKAAGDSVHDMKMKANTKCSCADCDRYGRPSPAPDDDGTGELVSAGSAENNDNPF